LLSLSTTISATPWPAHAPWRPLCPSHRSSSSRNSFWLSLQCFCCCCCRTLFDLSHVFATSLSCHASLSTTTFVFIVSSHARGSFTSSTPALSSNACRIWTGLCRPWSLSSTSTIHSHRAQV
ncbi:hypothetical protein BGW38_008303, partial [Lunasporangiospora selenospora]